MKPEHPVVEVRLGGGLEEVGPYGGEQVVHWRFEVLVEILGRILLSDQIIYSDACFTCVRVSYTVSTYPLGFFWKTDASLKSLNEYKTSRSYSCPRYVHAQFTADVNANKKLYSSSPIQSSEASDAKHRFSDWSYQVFTGRI